LDQTKVEKKANFGPFMEKLLLKTKALWALVFSVLGFFYSLNATAQARPEAGAQRTLEGVSSSAELGAA
jgi:hypothetical protein